MREKIGFILGPVLVVGVLALPLDLQPEAHRLLALMLGVITWWICEPIPLPATALLGAALAVVFGITDQKTALAPFAHPLIYLFMGGFFLARAMKLHGLDRRFALFILTRNIVHKKPVRAVPALFGVTVFTAMWISNTATAAMMLPITLGVLAAIFPKSEPGQDAILIGAAYSASIGGIATPVGSTPNIIAMANLSKHTDAYITFPEWMLFALPILLMIMTALLGLVRWLLPSTPRTVAGTTLLNDYRALGSFTRGEANTLVALLVTTSLWVGPGLVALVVGKENAFVQWCRGHVPEAVAALVGSSLLFILRTERRPTLPWAEAAKIDWASLLLFGGGLSLGAMMFETGLAEIVGRFICDATGGNYWLFMATMVYFAIFFTETTSNTATANFMIPLVIGAAKTLGEDPVLPVLGVAVACSLAFMMPISTPPNAIFYGSGLVRIPRMMRMGWAMNLFSGMAILLGLLLFRMVRGT